MYPVKMKSFGFPVVSRMMEDVFENDLSKLAGHDFHFHAPKVNVIETANGFRLDVAAPGFNKEDFKLSIEKDTLMIRGEKKVENEEVKEKYTRKEFSFASFERKFTLPENINRDALEAAYNNGILSISLVKSEEERISKEIKVS